MNNHHVFIPSHGLGEIYLDLSNMHWYKHNSSYFNLKKEIPFFKLLLDMASLRMRCYTRLNVNCLFLPQIILDVGKRNTYLIQSFIKIKSLCKDLFCTSDIETLDYGMEVYQQFINREPLWQLGIKISSNKIKRWTISFWILLKKVIYSSI